MYKVIGKSRSLGWGGGQIKQLLRFWGIWECGKVDCVVTREPGHAVVWEASVNDHSVLRQVLVLGYQIKHRNTVVLARATRNAVAGE